MTMTQPRTNRPQHFTNSLCHSLTLPQTLSFCRSSSSALVREDRPRQPTASDEFPLGARDGDVVSDHDEFDG